MVTPRAALFTKEKHYVFNSSMSDSKIDLKHLSAACHEHFMRDQPPYPPDVKTLRDLSAFLRYKSLCLIDGEEPDPDVVDNNAFVGQLQHGGDEADDDDEVTSTMHVLRD
ncbi:hypothetical protein PVAP13_9KG282400 [Panicum virgatum]|uniref:Uncharacterized protein n=1 Tax=Panicum virgatum TaxID=38727 RepID=A0A8T0NPZ0_PANVG|nr:hypothetical protein PVAP13_9KG282400 [Panicum virgatum]